MALAVSDNPARSRYELHDGDHLVGFTEYHERPDGVLVFPHTVITVPKRGAGYGGTLVQGALDDVRAKGRTIVAECPFVQKFVADHPDYADLLAPKAS
jgi:predicted GNAT family acetyltransferase